MDNSKLTPLSELGEFGLIDELTKDVTFKNPSTVLGIGDDAAVIKAGGKKRILISKDLLLEGVHFDMTFTPLKHLGYKAAVVNFSDMAAMNALPKQIVVGIGVSSRYTLEALKELYAGIKKACEVYNVDFVGGDTTTSVHGLFISITVLGEANEDKIVYRKGAKPNDLLCVSGDLGGAYMGLLLLEREKKVFLANPDMQPELSGNDYVLERQLKPEARTDIVRQLAKHKILPTSMIDISDGLASEALHIAKNSGVGVTIVEEKIPIAQNTYDLAKEFNIIPSIAALNGGEDYELLFTVDQKDFEELKKTDDITIIGYVTDAAEGNRLITPDNHSIELKAQGWDGLKGRTEGKINGQDEKK
jgi:thiamine-monophosphate kinase